MLLLRRREKPWMGMLLLLGWSLWTVDDNQDLDSAKGFCPDMLERLQIFAAQDNVTLKYEFKLALPSYDDGLDLVANDCHTNGNIIDDKGDACDGYDLIALDYYYTKERAMRIHYSPAWLHGAISAVQYVPNNTLSSDTTSTYNVDANGQTNQDEFLTMARASREGQSVCLVAGTFIVTVAQTGFPGADYVLCPDQQTCIDQLKAGDCRLYVDDRLQLNYRAVSDPTLVVSGETFHPQYITWVLNERTLAPLVLRLLDRWLIAAHQNGTFGELYEKYFEKEPCPLGRAGPNCELPCHADHGKANAHDGACVCESPKWTGEDCSFEVPEDLNRIPTELKVFAYCLVAINFLVIAICAVWLVMHRSSMQVTIAQPSFLMLVLLGCAVSSSAILAMAQEDTATEEPNRACMAIPFLYSVGFCITFGSLFAKIRRIYILFKSSAEMKRVTVSFMESAAVIGSILAVDLIILILWGVLDPLQWQRTVITADQLGDPLESQGYCTSNHWMAFAGAIAALHLVLLLVASWMCYLSRHISSKFSEGKYVTIAVISNLQIFVVALPVLIVVGSEPATSFFVRSVVVWMNDLVVVLLIFGNLIYSVSFANNELIQTKLEIRDAIMEFSRHDELGSSLHSRHSDHSHGGSGGGGGFSSHSLFESITSHARKSDRSHSPAPFDFDTISLASSSSPLPVKAIHCDLEKVNSSWKAHHSTNTKYSASTGDLHIETNQSPSTMPDEENGNERLASPTTSASLDPVFEVLDKDSSVPDSAKQSFAEEDMEGDSNHERDGRCAPEAVESELQLQTPK